MTFLNEEQLNSLNKESMAMIIKTLQGQIMLLDTTNKKLSVQLEAAEETTQKLSPQVEALTAQIRLYLAEIPLLCGFSLWYAPMFERLHLKYVNYGFLLT